MLFENYSDLLELLLQELNGSRSVLAGGAPFSGRDALPHKYQIFRLIFKKYIIKKRP